MAINRGRLAAGGLVAGIVITVFEFLCGMIYAEPWRAALQAHNLTVPEGPRSLACYLLMGFIAGFAVVWFYAAARPRFGPGPKTAALVGLVFWVPYYLLCIGGISILKLYPNSMLAGWAAIGLVGLLVATVAGAWVYREV